jgi:c-di-GMP-binding flagellar brake protein YcgR
MILILLTSLFILGLILMVIYRNEYRLKKTNSPDGRIKEYWEGAERRRTVRLEIPLSVKYTALPPHNHNSNSITRNISKGGIQMLIYEKLNVGDVISLKLNLDSQSQPISGRGEIAWLKDASPEAGATEKRSFIAGIKFIDLKPKDEERLNSFIYNQCCLADSSTAGVENA